MKSEYDIAIIGGGIVGLATAFALSEVSSLSVVIVEAEDRIAAHQSSHNSGVIHSGIYYKPGSLKARTCLEGRRLLIDLCKTHGVPYQQCGKLIVATKEGQIPVLNTLEERGYGNGLQGIRRLTADEITEFEPHARGKAGLWVPDTGIVDFYRVCEKIAELARNRGVSIITSARLEKVIKGPHWLLLKTVKGEIRCKLLVNCAGLYCDRIARMCGLHPGMAIIPFRGEYYELRKERESLVRNLIYPVPDPRFPFLGVHFTRRLNGTVEIGPNAVLAFSRTGYTRTDISIRDISEMLTFSGFWKLASRHWKTGAYEMWRSFSKSAFLSAARQLVPDLSEQDLVPGGSGVRAQAVTLDGKLADDFIIKYGDRSLHILNAPSPAATASLSIGRMIAHEARSALR